MFLRRVTHWAKTFHLCAGVRLTYRVPNMTRPSSDLTQFRKDFAKAKHIAIITGAGVSAESGVPTFRGAGGYWRKWQAQVTHMINVIHFFPLLFAVFLLLCYFPCKQPYLSISLQDLATPGAFSRDPSLVWEFYHYRREVMSSKEPNAAHMAIAECEARLSQQGRSVVVITQNIDELHYRAGSRNILELHGSLFKTRCMSCGEVKANHTSPICPALEGKGAPDPEAKEARIPVNDLPRCERRGCHGLLRPYVVWFGEALDSDILSSVEEELEKCDLCLVVGTSSIVYPAAMFAPQVAARGVPVAEFNTESTPATMRFMYHFEGPCGTTLPPALARHESEPI
uniref:NAD-dependent protein deacylase sirtuin-5, mitochondrial n=1 Tax=Astyanax mexicanus TaxID=7994 RepID=A0A8B9JH41_ASTMX